MTGTKEAEALCGADSAHTGRVGQDNKTLRSSELQKHLCRACAEAHTGQMETVA